MFTKDGVVQDFACPECNVSILPQWQESAPDPSFRSSPWLRGAPQSGFSRLIRLISIRKSASICGRPPRFYDCEKTLFRP
jgi:hypothetical protein